MRRIAPVLVAAGFLAVVLIAWVLLDGWRADRCHKVGATAQHIDRAVICVTPDGRIVEP